MDKNAKQPRKVAKNATPPNKRTALPLAAQRLAAMPPEPSRIVPPHPVPSSDEDVFSYIWHSTAKLQNSSEDSLSPGSTRSLAEASTLAEVSLNKRKFFSAYNSTETAPEAASTSQRPNMLDTPSISSSYGSADDSTNTYMFSPTQLGPTRPTHAYWHSLYAEPHNELLKRDLSETISERRRFDSRSLRFLNLFKVEPEGYKLHFSPTSVSSLIRCLKNGDLHQVQEEMALREFDVNSPINGRSALHYAADYGQYETMRFLLSQGANVDAQDGYGVTPLLVTIWEGHTSCAELLLSHGASKRRRTPDGKTYLEAAEKEEIRRLLS